MENKIKTIAVDTFGKIYKQERIGIRAFDYVPNGSSPCVDDEHTENVTDSANAVRLNIKYSIGAKKISEISQTVANSVFDEDTGDFIPEYVDFLINVQILEEYAYFRIPRDLEQVYRFIAETDVVDFVKSKINQEELGAIHNGVFRRLEYMKQIYLAEAQNGVARITSKLEEIADNIARNFKNVDVERLISVAEKISSTPKDALVKVNKDKIAQAKVINIDATKTTE